MALIKCPECGKEISDRAKACPSCAYPLPQSSFSTPPPVPRGPVQGSGGYRSETQMRFRNPVNGATVEINNPAAWTLLFGGFYWLKHEAWAEAILALGAAFFTAGLAWLIAPFFAKMALRGSYLRKGWLEV